MLRHGFRCQGLSWTFDQRSCNTSIEKLTLPHPGFPYSAIIHPELFPCTTSASNKSFFSLECTSIRDLTTSLYASLSTRCRNGASVHVTGKSLSTENSPHFLWTKLKPCKVGGRRCPLVVGDQSGSSPRSIISASLVLTSSLRAKVSVCLRSCVSDLLPDIHDGDRTSELPHVDHGPTLAVDAHPERSNASAWDVTCQGRAKTKTYPPECAFITNDPLYPQYTCAQCCQYFISRILGHKTRGLLVGRSGTVLKPMVSAISTGDSSDLPMNLARISSLSGRTGSVEMGFNFYDRTSASEHTPGESSWTYGKL